MAAALRRNPRLSSLLTTHFSTLSAAVPDIEPPSPNPEPPPPSPSPSPAKSLSRLKTLIRSESDPDRIAALFQSNTHLPRFHADRPLYTLAIHKLGRSRRPDLIQRLLDLPPPQPISEGFLTRIITLYSTAGMPDHALLTFQHAAASPAHPPLTHRSLSALLSAFLKARQFDRVIDSFHTLPTELNITSGIVPHNILLQALCRKGDLAAARNVLDEMINKNSDSLKPDIISYNALLDGYLSIGDEDKFNGILSEISCKALVPNVVTYNCRIAAFCRKKESFRGEELLDVMVSKDVPPNRSSFKTVIDGFYRQDDVGSALRVFKKMKATKRRDSRDDLAPDADTYNMLIRGLVKKGEFDSALEVCKECLARKLIPPFEQVKGLVEHLRQNSKMEEAEGILKKMRGILYGEAAQSWKKVETELSVKGAKVDSQEN